MVSLSARIQELYNGRNLNEVALETGLTPAQVQAYLLDPSLPDPVASGVKSTSVQAGGEDFGRAIGKNGRPITAINPLHYWAEDREIPFAPVAHQQTPWGSKEVPFRWLNLHAPTVVDVSSSSYGYSFIGDLGGDDFRRATKVDMGFDMPWRDRTIREWWIGEGGFLAAGVQSGQWPLSPVNSGPMDNFRTSSYATEIVAAGVIYADSAQTILRYATIDLHGEDVFVVEWNMHFQDGEGPVILQAHLHEHGIIEIHVQTVAEAPPGHEVTIGLGHVPIGSAAIETALAVIDEVEVDYVDTVIDRKAVRLADAPVEVPGLAEPVNLWDRFRRETADYNWLDLDDPVILAPEDFATPGNREMDGGTSHIVDPGFDLLFGPDGIQRKWLIQIDGTITTWDDDLYQADFNQNQASYYYGNDLRTIASNTNQPYQRNGVSISGNDLCLPEYQTSSPPAEWTGIRYQTVGRPPNRIFVVEHCVPYYTQDGDIGPNTPGNYIQAQVHFHEADGSVEIHYKHDNPPEGYTPESGSGPTSGIWWSAPWNAGYNNESAWLLSEIDGAVFDYDLWADGDPHPGGLPAEVAVRFVQVPSTNYAVPWQDYNSREVEKLGLPCRFPFGPSGHTKDWWVSTVGTLQARPTVDDANPFPSPTRPLSSPNAAAIDARSAWGIMALGATALQDAPDDAGHHIHYAVVGEPPNRILVLELFADDLMGEEVNVQVHLHETGELDYHYTTVGGYPDAGVFPISPGIWWDVVDGSPIIPGDLPPYFRFLRKYSDGDILNGVIDANFAAALTEKAHRLTPATVVASREPLVLPPGTIAIDRASDVAPAARDSRVYLTAGRNGVALVTEAGQTNLPSEAALTAQIASAINSEATTRLQGDQDAYFHAFRQRTGISLEGGRKLWLWIDPNVALIPGRDVVAFYEKGYSRYQVSAGAARPYTSAHDAIGGGTRKGMGFSFGGGGGQRFSTPIALTPFFTWFVLVHTDDDAGGALIGSDTGWGPELALVAEAGGLRPVLRHNGGAVVRQASGTVPYSTDVVIAVRQSPSGIDFWLGAWGATDVPGGSYLDWASLVGHRYQIGNNFEGLIGESFAFGDSLSDGDVAAMNYYLMNEWNVP